MKYRKLGIMFSIACGIACVLLMLLWVRSKGGLEGLTISPRHHIQSSKGRLHVNANFGIPYKVPYSEMQLTRDLYPYLYSYRDIGDDKVKYIGGGNSVPLWTLIVGTAGFAFAPWLPWRFALRTLSIAAKAIGLNSPQPVSRTRRLLRHLRVVLSGLCILVAVLLIVLWVSSYWRAYSLERPNGSTGSICFQSCDSVVGFAVSDRDLAQPQGWKLFDESVEKRAKDTGGPPDPFVWMYAPGFFYLACPHWIPVMILIAAAVAPWLTWRFSLRTLLIAMTVIAALLGALAYAFK